MRHFLTVPERLRVGVLNRIEQLSELTELNCEEGQGYFFSKPVEACEVETLAVSQLKRGMCLSVPNGEADYCPESVN